VYELGGGGGGRGEEEVNRISAAVLAPSFPASQHIGLVGLAAGLPVQGYREVHDPGSSGRLG
jgi:hypothetical protein